MKDFSEIWPLHRAALIVAHPGHELRVHGWLLKARPLTFVFTDGSGSAGGGRLASTTRLLGQAGCATGSLYGRLSDKKLYQLVMERQHAPFIDLAKELARELASARVDYVVGDAEEGYNPGHDVCRLIINTALKILQARTGRQPLSFDFLLAGRPDENRTEDHARSIRLTLDEAAMQRKLAAAQAYPELAQEMNAALAKHGLEAFRHEILRPCSSDASMAPVLRGKPFYESYGEQQVAKGRYQTVLRWEEHMRPLALALQKCADTA